jgi:hypothetical protein
MSAAPIKNRVTEITGTDYPIIQAPMSWIAEPNWPRQSAMPVAWALSKPAPVSSTRSAVRS